MPVHDAIEGSPAGVFPLELIDRAIEEARAGQRRRRLLPAAAVMIFVLGCALFYGDSYGEVARKVERWLEPLAGPGGWRMPGAAALARARRRLGPRPFELLFAALRGPLADPAVPGVSAFGRELVLMSVDGTSLDLPATPAVIEAYGPPPSGGGPGGYPQLRLLTLVSCGTRGIADAVFGPRKTSEQDLARQIAGRGALIPGMLVLADRNFCGHKVIAPLTGTGADILVRARAGQVLPVLEALPDGSARAVLPDPAAAIRRLHRNGHRRRRHSRLPPDPPVTDGIHIRLIEADITTTPAGGQPRTERYRLITTLLDHAAAPAPAIAALYHQRWESETTYAHLKTTLRGSRRILRSRDQPGIEQETWALLCAHQLLTATRTHAAATARLDPDRASYTVTLRAIRRQITTPGHTTAHATTEILAQLLPPRRRPRSYPRHTRTSTAKRRAKRPPAAHTTCTITITPPAPDP